MTDFLAEKNREITARLNELKPLVEEYVRLEAAKAALDGLGTTGLPGANGPRDGDAAPDGQRRRGRPRGSGSRGQQALEVVKANPGISIPEIAEKIGIQQNYLYRVLPMLVEDRLVEKRGRGWHPVGS